MASKKCLVILALLIAQAPLVSQSGCKAFLGEDGRYGIRDSKGKTLVNASMKVLQTYDEYRLLGGSNYQVLIDDELTVLYQIKDGSIAIHALKSEKIVLLQSEKKQSWKFWKWTREKKFRPIGDIFGRSTYLNKEYFLCTYIFYRLGDKNPFYSFSQDKAQALAKLFPYRFYAEGDAFVIDTTLFNIKNGVVKKIRSDILNDDKNPGPNKIPLIAGTRKKAHVIDFYNKPVYDASFKIENYVDVEFEDGDVLVSMRIHSINNVYKSTQGEVFIRPQFEVPFPKKIYQTVDKKEKVESFLERINFISVLPDKPYFVLVRKAYGSGKARLYLLDAEGNWVDGDVFQEYRITYPVMQDFNWLDIRKKSDENTRSRIK